MRKPNLVSRFMAEQVYFGGEIMARSEVARIMQAEGNSARQIDYFAFGVPTAEQFRKLYPYIKRRE